MNKDLNLKVGTMFFNNLNLANRQFPRKNDSLYTDLFPKLVKEKELPDTIDNDFIKR